jgi:hypothetical protein
MNKQSDLPGTLPQAFERRCVLVPVASLRYLKPFRDSCRKSKKYQQIVASIRAIGIVEPPVVVIDPAQAGHYLVLDGNLRIEALKDLAIGEVECLVAADDETYTYNKRVSRLNTTQDHRMIVKAVERGVPAERIAEALGLDIATIRRRFRLLDGICDEAQKALEDKACPVRVFDILRCMTPLRQIEAVELMVGHNSYSVLFANALLAATPPEKMVKKTNPKQEENTARELFIRQERELSLLQVHLKAIESDLGENVLLLMITKGYLKKLLGSNKVIKWLAQKHPDYLQGLQEIVDVDAVPGAG